MVIVEPGSSVICVPVKRVDFSKRFESNSIISSRTPDVDYDGNNKWYPGNIVSVVRRKQNRFLDARTLRDIGWNTVYSARFLEILLLVTTRPVTRSDNVADKGFSCLGPLVAGLGEAGSNVTTPTLLFLFDWASERNHKTGKRTTVCRVTRLVYPRSDLRRGRGI